MATNPYNTGLGLLSSFQRAAGSSSPALSERAAMHDFNVSRVKEIQKEQAFELADAEGGLLEAGYKGNQRSIKATDLYDHYGSQEFISRFEGIGGNYLLGYGPNAIVSGVNVVEGRTNQDPKKGKIGERIFDIKVSSI